MIRQKIAVVALIVFSASSFGSSSEVAPLANIPGGAFGSANGVSTAGIVGEIFTGNLSDISQPIVWQGSLTTVLPLAPGFQGRALGIGAAGDVAGYVWTTDVSVAQPALWRNGQLQMLDTLGMPSGNANAVNDSGNVAGSINDLLNPVPRSQAVVWIAGQAQVLGNFPNAQAWAPALNNQGQVLVTAAYGDHSEGWIWSHGTLTQMISASGASLAGSSINNLGNVAGTTLVSDGHSNNRSAAFLWMDGESSLLPEPTDTIFSTALSINDLNQVVGTGFNPLGQSYALLWENGQVMNLNDLIPLDSGWTLLASQGIDNDGTIVGIGLFDGQQQAFKLTTTSASPSVAAPEPATAATLLLALPLLLRRHRRTT